MIRFHNITATRSIGIPLGDIENRRYNLWLGISIDNKFFTPINIHALIQFALRFTKEKILLLVPGRMHATNYYYFEKQRRAEALKRGFADEDRVRENLQQIIATLPTTLQRAITIANYDDISTPRFIKQRETLFREFGRQEKLYTDVLAVTREMVLARKRTPTAHFLESLALYVIQELPLFLDGIQTLNHSTVYNAILYPGMGKLDELVQKIKTEGEYATLRDKLNVQHPSGIVDIQWGTEK